jgi:hypothetical protein
MYCWGLRRVRSNNIVSSPQITSIIEEEEHSASERNIQMYCDIIEFLDASSATMNSLNDFVIPEADLPPEPSLKRVNRFMKFIAPPDESPADANCANMGSIGTDHFDIDDD